MSAATESPKRSPQIGAVFDDAWNLYKGLFRQTVVIGGLVFAALGLLDLALATVSNRIAQLLLTLLALALPIIGTTLVQGALVEVVNEEHEGRRKPPVGELYRTAWHKVWRLIVVSVLTGLGVGLGLLLLVVPGIILFVGWSLAVPVVVLESEKPRAAMRRSRELVRGHRWTVFGSLLIAGVVTGFVTFAIRELARGVLGSTHPLLVGWVAFTFGGAVATPYFSHVLSVLYYRLAEPGRPVLPEPERAWGSIWDKPST